MALYHNQTCQEELCKTLLAVKTTLLSKWREVHYLPKVQGTVGTAAAGTTAGHPGVGSYGVL